MFKKEKSLASTEKILQCFGENRPYLSLLIYFDTYEYVYLNHSIK